MADSTPLTVPISAPPSEAPMSTAVTYTIHRNQTVRKIEGDDPSKWRWHRPPSPFAWMLKRRRSISQNISEATAVRCQSIEPAIVKLEPRLVWTLYLFKLDCHSFCVLTAFANGYQMRCQLFATSARDWRPSRCLVPSRSSTRSS